MLSTMVTRRTVLHLLGTAAATTALAACGAAPPSPTLALPTPAPAPVPRPTLDDAWRAKIDDAIAKTVAGWAPGVAVGVIRERQIVYTAGVGTAEVGTTRPVTPHSVFLLWSIAMNVVTTVIMHLKEQGTLSLDASVTAYLPYLREIDEGFQAVTIRHLLAQNVGFVGSGAAFDLDLQAPEEDDGALERSLRNPARQPTVLQPADGVFSCQCSREMALAHIAWSGRNRHRPVYQQFPGHTSVPLRRASSNHFPPVKCPVVPGRAC